MRDGCVFCDYDGPSAVLAQGSRSDEYGTDEFIVIEPLSPVTPGHLLVIPLDHVEDFRDAPDVLGVMMEIAAGIAADKYPRFGCNLIVSAGSEATQTVPHLHVHVVPRRPGDGLRLPWA